MNSLRKRLNAVKYGVEEIDALLRRGKEVKSDTEKEDALRGPNVFDEQEVRLNNALDLLAMRWHGEIVSEKSGIVLGGIIIYLYFPADAIANSAENLFKLTGIFYSLEMFADMIFVWVMTQQYNVPLLRLPYESHQSKTYANQLMQVTLTNVVVCLCIGMAVNIDV